AGAAGLFRPSPGPTSSETSSPSPEWQVRRPPRRAGGRRGGTARTPWPPAAVALRRARPLEFAEGLSCRPPGQRPPGRPRLRALPPCDNCGAYRVPPDGLGNELNFAAAAQDYLRPEAAVSRRSSGRPVLKTRRVARRPDRVP